MAAAIAHRVRRHERAYGRLLAVYPWRFRRRFGAEMRQLFRDRLIDALDRRRRGAVTLLWAATISDLVRSAPAERVRGVLDVRWRGLVPTGPRAGMGRFAARRLVAGLPVLLGASVLVFLVIRTTVDPLGGCALNPRVAAADCLRLRHQWGPDRSLAAQYWTWLGHFLQGDWGRSLISNRPVLPDVRSALANTLVLGILATALSLGLGIVVGLASVLRRSSALDHLATGGAFLGLSIPSFWFAVLLQVFVGVSLTRWLHLSAPVLATSGLSTPGTSGFNLVDRLRHLALPVLVLSVQEVAVFSRYVRTGLLETLGADYLRTARAKGLADGKVVVRHALRNALIPLSSVSGLSIGSLAGGVIITEVVFQYPGMGRLFVEAMRVGDFVVVLPWVMVAAGCVLVANLATDIAYAFLDPRVRYA